MGRNRVILWYNIPMAKKLIVGNWKMNPQSVKEAEILFKSLIKIDSSKNASIVVCPPHPYLSIHSKYKTKRVILGAQDVSIEDSGSHTGEVGASMLKSLGASYVIVGHSERRKIGNTDAIVNKKILNILKNKMFPIVCVGEHVRDSGGDYLSFIKNQLHQAFANISKSQVKNIVIAYEPIWAIGKESVREATAEEFIEVKIFIRKIISDIYSANIAHNMAILYGGSVNPKNASAFLHHGGADGFLIGRDSLVPKKFELIIKSA